MKNILAGFGFFAIALAASAGTYTFKPNDGQGNTADMFDLDHHYAYSWGVSTSSNSTNSPGLNLYNALVTGGQRIVSAKLTIWNIWDWRVEADILNIHLLNTPSSGVRSYQDNYYDNTNNGDYFAPASRSSGLTYSAQVFLASWSDPVGGVNNGFDLMHNFTTAQVTTLSSWIKDGSTWGIGFDPDCHYFNDGVQLEIKTVAVPDGGVTVALLGLGLAVLAGIRRRSSR